MPTLPPSFHQRIRATNPERRQTAHERGYTSRWRRYAKQFLARPENALCVRCTTEGKTVAAECVDHYRVIYRTQGNLILVPR